MIVQVMGTNGAGKSFLVRTILDEAKRDSVECSELHVEGRRRPLAMELRYKTGGGLFVPGHYNIPCGGCDTLRTVDEAFDLVLQEVKSGMHVLFEGIMVMDAVERTIALSREADLVVIGLTTRLGACVDAVRDRRLSRGDAPDFDPGNTIDRARRCARGLDRLKAAEVTVLMLSRAEALAWCREKLLRHSSKWPSEVRILAGPDRTAPNHTKGPWKKIYAGNAGQ